MAAPWLSSSGADSFELEDIRYDVAGFYREGILAGTDPANPEYWGDPVDFAQHLVEMASLAWGLWQSRARIWERLGDAERRRVASYLQACTKVKYHANNWLLFNVVTNAALKRLGMPYDQGQLERNLEFCEGMYLGDGWYQDGDVPRIDYYNAWAFHYYYLIWAVLDGESRPELARTHIRRAEEFLTYHGERRGHALLRPLRDISVRLHRSHSPLSHGGLGRLGEALRPAAQRGGPRAQVVPDQADIKRRRAPVAGLRRGLLGYAGALFLRRLAVLGREGL
jgi:hypothetical protein